MNRIKILPESVFNKIAAGEVIERPASVVKELLENSLDAGAARIKISIEEYGLKQICISDDGCGMSPDDALLCLEAHATSKIEKAEDLNSIKTLGFRGEALPSIASVSRLRIRTKLRGSSEGTEVQCDGGKIIRCEPTGCTEGTEIIVRDLFYNVPARKKFLGSPETEEKHITEIAINAALANFATAFALIIDGRERFNSPANDEPESRIAALFGKSFLEQLLPVDYEEGGIKISGFTAKHGFSKTNRREQRIFVNGRPAECPSVFAGIKDAYSSIIPAGRFPPLILFIECNPLRVDVNVHPAKREVRFREPSLFRKAVEKALREALRNSQTATIHISPEISLKQLLDASTVNYSPEEKERKKIIENNTFLPFANERQFPAKEIKKDEKGDAEQKPAHRADNIFDGMQIIGVLDESFLLASSPDGLIIIDQHAAHERILYEKLIKSTESSTSYVQKLLIPITVELTPAEAAFISKCSNELAHLGFDIENFGGNTVVVHSVPSTFPQENIVPMLKDMLEKLIAEGAGSRSKPDHLQIAREACSSAVKAHQSLKAQEIKNLLAELSRCEMPFCCPHGRPTMINISKAELRKRFGRSMENK